MEGGGAYLTKAIRGTGGGEWRRRVRGGGAAVLAGRRPSASSGRIPYRVVRLSVVIEQAREREETSTGD